MLNGLINSTKQEPVKAIHIGFDWLDNKQLVATYAVPVATNLYVPDLYTTPQQSKDPEQGHEQEPMAIELALAGLVDKITGGLDSGDLLADASVASSILDAMAAGKLNWTEPAPPTKDVCSYDHVTAQTPFGRFLITWKGWKETPSYGFDETPWGDTWYCSFYSLEEAKQWAEDEYNKRVRGQGFING